MPVIDVDSHFQGPFTWFDAGVPRAGGAVPGGPGAEHDRRAGRRAGRRDAGDAAAGGSPRRPDGPRPRPVAAGCGAVRREAEPGRDRRADLRHRHAARRRPARAASRPPLPREGWMGHGRARRVPRRGRRRRAARIGQLPADLSRPRRRAGEGEHRSRQHVDRRPHRSSRGTGSCRSRTCGWRTSTGRSRR